MRRSMQQLCRSVSSCARVAELRHGAVCNRQLYEPNLCQNRHWSFSSVHWQRKTFISKLIESVNEEMKHNKELNENKRRLKEELENLNQSDALQKARAKFQSVEQETMKSSEVLKKKLDELKEQMEKAIGDVKKTEYGKKASDVGEQVLKSTRQSAETLEKLAQNIGDTPGFKNIATTMRAVQVEIDEVTLGGTRFYQAPDRLRLRSELENRRQRTVEANTEATGVAVSSDSNWFQSWRDKVEGSSYYNKFVDWKMQFDESDHAFARMTRAVTDKAKDISGSGEKSGLAAVMGEVSRMEPDFDKYTFLRYCELEVIPNVLEAMIRGELDVLEDWCHERAYKTIEAQVKHVRTLGLSFASKVINVDKLDLMTGSMMEQGPVLIVSFVADQIEAHVDKTGKVVSGDAEEPKRVNHVWALVRDLDELDPRLAWKVLEIHHYATKLLF